MLREVSKSQKDGFLGFVVWVVFFKLYVDISHTHTHRK